MKLLVCGGAGFIGSNFVRNHLQTKHDDTVTNLDNLAIGSNIQNLKEIEHYPNYHFIKEDIRNLDTISNLVKENDIIINFAAETHVDRSISNPKPFIETNILGTYTLLEAIRRYDKQFVHISTDEVYGEAYNNTSFTEDDPPKPTNPYSASKASSDLLVNSYVKTYGLSCIITRSSNNFGPYQFPEKLVPKTIIRATRNLKVPLYGNGNQIRSWIYVMDNIEAIESLIEKGRAGQIYNITAWNEISNREIVEKILQLLQKPTGLIENVKDRPGHDKRYSIDAAKIQNTTGWRPRFDFDTSLKETVSWYQNNQLWWEPLADERTLHPQPWVLNW